MRTLKQARLEAGYTQTELGILVNKSTQTIRDYEKGAYKIGKEALQELIKHVGEFKPTRE